MRGELELMLCELLRGDELMLGELLRGALLRGDELMLGELLRGEEPGGLPAVDGRAEGRKFAVDRERVER